MKENINYKELYENLEKENELLKEDLKKMKENELTNKNTINNIKNIIKEQETNYNKIIEENKKRVNDIECDYKKYKEMLEEQYKVIEFKFNNEIDNLENELNEKKEIIKILQKKNESLNILLKNNNILVKFYKNNFNTQLILKKRKIDDLTKLLEKINCEHSLEIQNISDKLNFFEKKSENIITNSFSFLNNPVHCETINSLNLTNEENEEKEIINEDNEELLKKIEKMTEIIDNKNKEIETLRSKAEEDKQKYQHDLESIKKSQKDNLHNSETFISQQSKKNFLMNSLLTFSGPQKNTDKTEN